MIADAAAPDAPSRLLRGLLGWWQPVHLGAVMLVLALAPSSYRRAPRLALAHRLWVDVAPVLAGFTLLSALVSLVLIHIVLATAQSYGLSRYALETLVRVLVLELIPLTAAFFVALRCTIPNGVELAQRRQAGVLEALRAQGADPLQHEVLPRVVSGVFSVLMLAAVSSVVALVLTYFSLYGGSSAGFATYTRRVGQVFTPAVTLIFALKTLLLSVTVALVPVAAGLHRRRLRGRAPELQGLVRLFAAVLLIEIVALVGNYY